MMMVIVVVVMMTIDDDDEDNGGGGCEINLWDKKSTTRVLPGTLSVHLRKLVGFVHKFYVP